MVRNSSLRVWALGMGVAFVPPMIGSLSADQFGLFTDESDANTIEITDFPTDHVGHVVIPSEIVGLPVTTVGERAFYRCGDVVSITVPSSVTAIANEAFARCGGLTAMTVPESVATLGSNARPVRQQTRGRIWETSSRIRNLFASRHVPDSTVPSCGHWIPEGMVLSSFHGGEGAAKGKS